MNAENFKNIFSKNLKKYMNEYNINNRELSNIVGVSESTVGKWLLKKTIPRMGIIEKLANYFNIEKSDLLEENSPQQSVGIRIPVLGRVAAGIPLEAIQSIDDWEEISPQMAKGGDFFALKINGESMHPEIKNGDTVIVKKQSDIDSGDIAIVLINGNDATCKQIQKQQTGITLIGYNVGVYSPTFYTNEEIENLPIVILGKVVEVRRKL
ncbi:LexA family protein [Dialister micraerophilus]|uniref:LexA family protein n=1 Tax=Dialister micraerophilus TaxID=309120 RepID=UPI0023F23018|nr:XRE family transcriptional regulator [Dialister micraerophilus]